MKKLLAIILAIVLMIPVTGLAEFDLSALSNAELSDLISKAQQELTSRNSSDADSQIVLYDDNDIKWYVADYETSDWSSYATIKTVVENNSKKNITASIETFTVNGWDVSTFIYAQVSAGKKSKEDISFDLEEASINKLEEITTLEVKISIIDSDSYKTIDETTLNLTPAF